MPTLPRRGLLAAALVAALSLAGCAAMRDLSTEVSSYGEWPAGRAPGSYAFERLPSQQAQAAQTEALENAARPALAKAGFVPVEAGREPDVLVQVGARTSVAEYPAWDDPLWWRGGFGAWRYGPWMAPRWSLHAQYTSARYEREVAVLIRDRSGGKPLFEARASSAGTSRAGAEIVAAMFEAALTDFPRLGLNPRRVVVALPQ